MSQPKTLGMSEIYDFCRHQLMRSVPALEVANGDLHVLKLHPDYPPEEHHAPLDQLMTDHIIHEYSIIDANRPAILALRPRTAGGSEPAEPSQL